MGKRRVINVGDVFGKLSILEEAEPQHYFKKSGKPYTKRVFKVKCGCDKGTIFDVQLNHLVTGKIVGCGCVREEKTTIHGMSNTSTYAVWECMKTRCYRENHGEYFRYGGSGVTVCDRWLQSFENFLEDMGERPDGHSLNRVNGSKIYSKDTCEWATFSVQSYDTKLRSTNKSGKTGVCFDNIRCKWMAYIGVNNKFIWLGHFSDMCDAIKARESAEIKYYGFTKE